MTLPNALLRRASNSSKPRSAPLSSAIVVRDFDGDKGFEFPIARASCKDPSEAPYATRNFSKFAVSEDGKNAREEKSMANESCDPTPAPNEAVKPGARTVHCVKIWQRIARPGAYPWQVNWGSALYESVSNGRLEALAGAFQDDHE